MQVTAYKDPETGQLFEHEKDYTAHMARRRREAAATAQREAAFARQAALKLTLVEKLESLEQLPELARAMYEGQLATYRLRRGKTALKVLDVIVKDASLSLSEQLRADITVVLDGSPEKAYSDGYFALYPHDVLQPFGLWGAGGVTNEPGRCIYHSTVTATLRALPKLRERLVQAAKLYLEEDNHLAEVQSATDAALATDSEYQQLDAAARKAFQDVCEAQERHTAALRAKQARKTALSEELARTMPFKRQAELEAAESLRTFIGQVAYTLRRPPTE